MCLASTRFTKINFNCFFFSTSCSILIYLCSFIYSFPTLIIILSSRSQFLWPPCFLSGEPEDRVQGELQVRGAGEVASQPGGHHAAAGRGILEVTFNISPWEACPCKRNFLILKNLKDFAEFDSATLFSLTFVCPKGFYIFSLIFAENEFWI